MEAEAAEPLQVSKVLKCHKKALNTAAVEEVEAAGAAEKAEPEQQQQRSGSAAQHECETLQSSSRSERQDSHTGTQ